MFANRYTALIDACALVGALSRNLLLTLAEADFYRVRWSAKILDETERAIAKILDGKGHTPVEAQNIAATQIKRMREAFEDAEVTDFECHMALRAGLPDPDDAHVIVAAVKAQAATIVTENLRHFPGDLLATLEIEARSADDFIADTIALDEGRAIGALRRMRERFRRPEMTAEDLLLRMEASGLMGTVDILRPHLDSL